MSLAITLIILSLSVLLFATINDIKTREVPDTLSYSFIVSVFLVRGVYAISDGWSVLFYGLVGFLAMFILGLVMYYTKQWGGGDSKIFMGLGATFGDFWLYDLPLLAVILASVLVVGTIYGSIWGVYVFIKNKKRSIPAFKKLLKDKRKYSIFSIVLGLLLVVSTFFLDNYGLRLSLLFIGICLTIMIHMYYFIKVIEEVGFIQRLPLSKVTEGDWLAQDVRYKGRVICSSKKACIDKKQLALMKKHKIKNVMIKVGIPFLPPITLGVIIAIILYLL